MASILELARYEAGYTNESIAASGSETFFISALDQAAKSQFKSFNNLEVVNDSTIDLFIDLDGLSIRRRKLFAKSTIVIKAEQGIFWDTIKITNTSSTTAVDASTLNLTGRIVSLQVV